MGLGELVLTAVPSLVGAVIGGFVVHVAAKRRDRVNDQRRQRIDYLLSAYRVLVRSAHRDMRGQRGEEFEDAISDVVVLGSAEQVEMATTVIENLASSKGASLDALLISLRRELREELGRPVDSLTEMPVVRMSWGEARPAAPLRAHTFEVLFEEKIATVRATLEGVRPPTGGAIFSGSGDLNALAESAPGAAVAGAYQQLHLAIATLLDDPEPADTVALARQALDAGLLAPETFRSVEGLAILTALSHNEGRGTGLSPERARDFLQLVQAVIYAIGPKAKRETQ